MGFATLIQDIVYKISGRPLASSGLYVLSDYSYDYALGGVPFLSATSDVRPDIEKPVPQRKDQFDAFKDPGEYSLNQWWLRSQSSWIGGEGVVYQDPDTQGDARNIRYAHSIGVDPFSDPDLLQLQRRVVDTGAVNSDANTGFAFVAPFLGSGGNSLYTAHGRTVYSYLVDTGSLVLNASTTLPYGGSGDYGISNGLVADPRESNLFSILRCYLAYQDAGTTTNRGIYKVAGEFALTATRIYAIPTGDLPSAMAWARSLLAVGIRDKLYMLDPDAAANTALPTANASVGTSQVITAITDGPDGVYVAANDQSNGYIYKSTFNSSTGVVNGLTLVAILPNGERINSIKSYINTFLVITTQNGVRVGTFTGDGIQYGPILIPTSQGESDYYYNQFVESGFGRIAFYKSFAYITSVGDSFHDGDRGIMAIDLSSSMTDNNTGATTNPYATWVYFPGETSQLFDIATTLDGRVVFTNWYSNSGKVYLEHATELIAQGYLDTGRCRFNTIEPKLFKYFSVRTPTDLMGDLSVAVLDDGGGVTPYITYGPTLVPGTDDIATPTPTGPRNWEALRFTLNRNGTDATKGAKLDSWQIKALPGTLKQRKIIRQFLCFNEERDKTGQIIRGDTLSLDRLTAIRQMCQRGDTVTLQDLVNNIADQVIIDDYQFTMMAPPGPNKENYGGYLTVEMRTVADSVPPISLAGSVEEE